MTIEELEAEALKLNPNFRARLAEKLLRSLEGVTDEEIERFWVEEAQRRDNDWNDAEARSAEEVLRDARAKIR
jgi:broad specificity phosphatase PhoE